MPLSLEQRAAMDAHIRAHTNSADLAHDVLTFRTYVIDSIERVMDSSRSRIRCLPLRNTAITCHDSSFWRTLAEIASEGADVDWHALEYGEPLNEVDSMTRCVYTWCCNRSVLKFYTKVLHLANGRHGLEWFVCKLTADEEHSGEDTDSEDIFVVG